MLSLNIVFFCAIYVYVSRFLLEGLRCPMRSAIVNPRLKLTCTSRLRMVLRRRRAQVNEGALSAKCFPSHTHVLTVDRDLFRDPGRDPGIPPDYLGPDAIHGATRCDNARCNKFISLSFVLQHHIKLRHGRHRRQHGGSYLPGNFVPDTDEPERGNWGPWSTPSSCSRSCGGGVAHQTRQCLDIE